MKKTKHTVTLDMILEYPKIFDLTRYVIKETGEEISKKDYDTGNYEGTVEVDTSQNGKPGDIDRGNPKADQKWLRELAKNPEAKMNAYFTSEEQIDFLCEFDGFDRITTNPQTGEQVDRIKEGNEEYGIGKYIQLKRKLNDIREFKNKQGQIEEMDKGGAPVVKILDVLEDETEAYVEYDYDTLGAPSNGTEAKVRFEPRYMRIDAVAITNLIEYIEEDQDDF